MEIKLAELLATGADLADIAICVLMWRLYMKVKSHELDIAVLKATTK